MALLPTGIYAGRRSRRRAYALVASAVVASASWLLPASSASAASNVLFVGSYNGLQGQYSTIQEAVNAAHPGDWILVGPGDYHEDADLTQGVTGTPAGVVITTSSIHIRGMSRTGVVVDGTLPGSLPCSANPADQQYGLRPAGATASGRSGILVQANNVDISNLTVCNFLSGAAAGSGRQVFWDGGTNGGHGFVGTYLTATTTVNGAPRSAPVVGFASNNWSGGTLDNTYASNFAASGYSITGCGLICNQTVTHAHAQGSPVGLAVTGAGGQLLIQSSEFDHNATGVSLSSVVNGVLAPQDGSCVAGAASPGSGTSCTLLRNNFIHDNNNANTPTSGPQGAPLGTGLAVMGGRNDTITNNKFANNNAWATLLTPVTYTSASSCPEGFQLFNLCTYDPAGDAVEGNTYSANGGYGNATNGDIAAANANYSPTDCFADNTESGGGAASTSPATLAQDQTVCGAPGHPNPNPPLKYQLGCDAGTSANPFATLFCSGAQYPQQGPVVLMPTPANLPTMPDPCVGVPGNPWCP